MKARLIATLQVAASFAIGFSTAYIVYVWP